MHGVKHWEGKGRSPDVLDVNGFGEVDGVPAGALIEAELQRLCGALCLVRRHQQQAPVVSILIDALHSPVDIYVSEASRLAVVSNSTKTMHPQKGENPSTMQLSECMLLEQSTFKGRGNISSSVAGRSCNRVRGADRVGRDILPGGAAVAREPRAHGVGGKVQELARVAHRHNDARRVLVRVEARPPIFATQWVRL